MKNNVYSLNENVVEKDQQIMDLHIHTKHSIDGKTEVRDALKFARKRGLSGVSFTDHNNIKGSLEGISLSKEFKDIIVVPGVEVSSSQGHILGYGIQEDIKEGMNAIETVEAIREFGGIAVCSHPLRTWSGLGEELTMKTSFDGIETFNARSYHKSNKKAGNIAKIKNLPETGGSDSHYMQTIGDGHIITSSCENWEDVIDAILKKNTKTNGKSRSFTHSIISGTRSVIKWSLRSFKSI